MKATTRADCVCERFCCCCCCLFVFKSFFSLLFHLDIVASCRAFILAFHFVQHSLCHWFNHFSCDIFDLILKKKMSRKLARHFASQSQVLVLRGGSGFPSLTAKDLAGGVPCWWLRLAGGLMISGARVPIGNTWRTRCRWVAADCNASRVLLCFVVVVFLICF